MKKLLASILVALMTLSLFACGGENTSDSSGNTSTSGNAETSETTEAAEPATAAYDSAVAVLEAALAGMSMKDELPVVGGSGETMTDGAPASVSVTDTDLFTYSLFLPEDVQGVLTEAADMMHMMNANTFTAVAIKIDGMNNSDAMSSIRTALQSAEYMCGAPEKFLFADVDGYVVYSFGEASYVESLKASIEGLSNVNSEIEVVDYEF